MLPAQALRVEPKRNRCSVASVEYDYSPKTISIVASAFNHKFYAPFHSLLRWPVVADASRSQAKHTRRHANWSWFLNIVANKMNGTAAAHILGRTVVVLLAQCALPAIISYTFGCGNHTRSTFLQIHLLFKFKNNSKSYLSHCHDRRHDTIASEWPAVGACPSTKTILCRQAKCCLCIAEWRI